jgi:hypothetical protein
MLSCCADGAGVRFGLIPEPSDIFVPIDYRRIHRDARRVFIGSHHMLDRVLTLLINTNPGVVRGGGPGVALHSQ